MKRWLLLILIVFSFPSLSLAQLDPQKALAAMQVADGLQIELFAAEPMLINPTSIDVDHKGRVWVCEAVNYRRVNFNRPILRPEGDRIVVLTDKDGDGKADESTVFYQGKDLYGPLGIAVAPFADGKGCKVFVCQSPDILLFEDKDGDLKADGPPKKFLTGFKGFDHDHGVHGINIGPDGRLYFTVGDSGVDGLQSSDGKGRKYKTGDKDCQAGTVWRCDMDGTHLELIAHNFRNNYECCVNSFSEIWLSDNDDDGNQQTRICHVMPGGNYGYWPRGAGQTHWHEEQPGIVHKTLRTGFGSPTGICFYEGNLLPKKYFGQLLHTDAGPRELRAFFIKPKGAGYELDKEVMVTSSDNWFRLSDVCVAPDGSLIVADWYDPGVGGHGMGDWTRGRIYRVTPKGHKGYKIPEIKRDFQDDLLSLLSSPCLASRALAQTRVRELDVANFTKIQSLISSKEIAPELKARFLSILPTVPSKLDPSLVLGLQKLNPRVDDPEPLRLLSFRLLVNFAHVLPKDLWKQWEQNVASEVAQLSSHPNFSKGIAREICLFVSKFSDPDASKPFIYAMAKLYDGQDHFYRAALNIACGDDTKRRDMILADFDKQFPEWNDKVADLVWELRPKSVLPRLGQLLEDAKITTKQRARIVDILATNDDPSAGKTLLTLLKSEQPAEVKLRAIENLQLFLPTKWSSLTKSDDLKQITEQLLSDTKNQSTGLLLVAAAKVGFAVDSVTKIAADASAKEELRIQAIRTLGKLPGNKTVESLIQLGTPENPLSVECVKALGQLLPQGQKSNEAGQKALESLQKALESSKASQLLKMTALDALAGNRQGTDWLLAWKEKNQMPESLIADAGRLLRNSPFQGQRNKALMLFPAAGKLDPKKLPPISELITKTGNVENGRKVMLASLTGESQCLRCHMIRGQGGNIGPDLSMIGKKASKENLYDSLLTPSKAIADQYIQWTIDTAAGTPITGLLMQETETAITLRDANGKDTVIPVKEIESRRKSQVSLMPEDLVRTLTMEEMIDLVEYMLTLTTPSLTPDSWHIIGPFQESLDPVAAIESAKTIDLSAKIQGKSGEVTWKTVKTSPSGYVDLAAHYGSESSHIASYLYREIESPIDQEATILIGNDDEVKLWVNGEVVLTNTDHFAAQPARLQVKVKLKKGINTILFKLTNGNNPHGFYFSLESTEQLKLGK